MKKEYRLVGMYGNIPFDEPAEKPYGPPMKFIEYVMDNQENICGAKFVIDLGHGYGFDNGEKIVAINLNEEFKFEHEYTDISDGTWDNNSYCVVVRFIAK